MTGFHTRLSAVCPFLGTRDPPLDTKPDWLDAEQDAPPPVRVKLERPRSFSQLAHADAKAVIDLCEPSPKKRGALWVVMLLTFQVMVKEQGEAQTLHLASTFLLVLHKSTLTLSLSWGLSWMIWILMRMWLQRLGMRCARIPVDRQFQAYCGGNHLKGC